jgi:hypothetical protein
MIAAALAALLAIAHSYLGERFILMPLFRQDQLPRFFGSTTFARQTLRLAWHITTALAFGMAALLVAAGNPGMLTDSFVTRTVSLACLASGTIALVVSRGRHLSWIVFFAIAALAWSGANP